MLRRLIVALRDIYLVKIKYRRFQIKRGFHSGKRVEIWANKTIEIGYNFYIGRDSFIETNCVIGDNVIFGNRVAIVGKYDHHYQEIGKPIRSASSIREKEYDWKGNELITRIGNDVWVGYGSTILQGVEIGNGAIIAAGSVVTKKVDSYCIYAGNPSKKIADRFNSKDDLKQHLELMKLKTTY